MTVDPDTSRLIERLQAAKDAAGIGVHDFDVLADTIYWDELVRDLWGVGPDEPIDYATFASVIDPADLPAVEAAVAAALDPAGNGRYEAEFAITRRSDGARKVIAATGKTTFRDGVAVRLVGTVRDVTEVREQQRARVAAEQFAQSLIATAPTLIYIYSLAEQRNIYLSPQGLDIIGAARDSLGSPGDINLIMHPDDLGRIADHHAALDAAGHDGPFSIEYRMRQRDGSWRWYASQDIVYERDSEGRVTTILGAAADITERHRNEEQRELLVGELNHRVKNVVAVVQAIASMTIRKHIEPALWQAFEERLASMGRAQDELVHGNWQSIDLRQLAGRTLGPYLRDGERLRLDGPEARLPAADAVNIAMAFHELATNSAKYGALSCDIGTVALTWDVDDDGIALGWIERDGPTVAPPQKTGFGLTVIRAADARRKAMIDFAPEGVSVRLRLRQA